MITFALYLKQEIMGAMDRMVTKLWFQLLSLIDWTYYTLQEFRQASLQNSGLESFVQCITGLNNNFQLTG